MIFTFDNDKPIYMQLVEQLKAYIVSGHLSPGERLPSVRELAIMSKVNPNTMQKALMELEHIGLIYTERTNGKFITKDTNLILSYRDEYAKSITNLFLKNMKDIGYNVSDAISYLNSNYSE